MRMTEEQLRERDARLAKSRKVIAPPSEPVVAESPKARLYALGRLKTGEMNKTEAEYDAHLQARFAAGEIVWWMFEGMKFRLADNTFYTPDFNVMTADGFIEHHEVKGYWEDDARVKIKVAAARFPFKFIGVHKRAKKDGGGWKFEEF